MNKKGFVLIETIVVIVIISVSLLTLFSSYNKILNKLKTENKFDTPEYLYMTNYIKERMKQSSPSSISTTFFDFSSTPSTASNPIDHLSRFNINEKPLLTKIFNVKHIYLVKGVTHTNTNENLKKFPPTVVEYIKKLDVTTSDQLIIVVYEREEVKPNLESKRIYCTSSNGSYSCDNSNETNILKKTFISSLRW